MTPSLRLSGKVAVITGAGSGIGKASAMRMLVEGASVVFADVNELTGMAALQEAVQSGYAARARFVKADVSQEADVASIVAVARSEFGRLDCMFNNAGIPGALGPLDEMRADEWDFTFAVLARSAFLGIKHSTRLFKQQGTGGVIINTASIAGMVGGTGPRAYSAAKAAVIHLSTVAAVELAPYRIRVNAICPGAILTPLGGKDQQAAIDRMTRSQPWPDHGRPEDIAGTACFLASDDARFITGTTIVVDGGACAAGPNIEQRTGRGDSWSGTSGIHFGTTGVKGELRRVR